MFFKRPKNSVKDKEYFKNYILNLNYVEYVNLMQAIMEITRETSKNMSELGLLKKNKAGKDEYESYFG
jgi:hypothetical protein